MGLNIVDMKLSDRLITSINLNFWYFANGYHFLSNAVFMGNSTDLANFGITLCLSELALYI